MANTYNSVEAIKAQAEYVKSKNYPHFAPYSGRCYNCGRDIYTLIDKGAYKTGISVEEAGSSHVTGCPHCNRSYCD